MASETAAAFGADRIAFVTRRYEELRGLMLVSYGASLLFASVAMFFLHASTAHPMSPTGAMLFAVLASDVTDFDRRYGDTFGRTHPPPFEFGMLASWTSIWVLIGALMDILVVGFVAVRWPSAAGIGLVISSGLVLLIDGRWRPYFVVPFCAGIVAIAMTAVVAPGENFPAWESDPIRTPVLMLANAFIGLGLVTAGALDHRLLAATLTPHSARTGPGEALRRSARRLTGFSGLVAACALLTLCFPARHMFLVLPPALMIVTMVGVPRAFRWIRRLLRREPGNLPAPGSYGLHPDTMIMFVVLAAAAVIDAAYMWPAPLALTTAFAMSSFWIALRDWPFRKHYLVGAVVPLLVLPLAIRLAPAAAFTLLLFACSAALAVESYFDGRGHESLRVSEFENADTI